MSDKVRAAVASAVTLVLATVVAWGLFTGEATETDRVAALGARIKCPVCQGESILDSPAPYAQDILALVEEQVDAGWTDGEIISYLEDRFNGIDLDPGFSGSTLALWLIPIAALGAGVSLARKRVRTEQPPPADRMQAQ